VLKDEAGTSFPDGGSEVRFSERGDAARNEVHILVVDSVIGSRFSLVQAASQPGFIVDAAASLDDALLHLERIRYALVIVDHDLQETSGLDMLSGLRRSHPEVRRALVTTRDVVESKRRAIESAGLSFILTKPWVPEDLRNNLRDLFGLGVGFTGWQRPGHPSPGPAPSDTRPEVVLEPNRHHEVLLRGLLAGLNSCESQNEVLELLHCELVEDFRLVRWLWLDEEANRVRSIEGDWPVEGGIRVEALGEAEQSLLSSAQRSHRVTRLEEIVAAGRGESETVCTVSLPIRISGRRAMTALVWADRGSAPELVSLLRELQRGLQMAFERIREAHQRAAAARDLARRVSEELRTPVGALSHAIDRLRGEAERAGISIEWMDRVSSESERVVRVVEHFEGEMLADQVRSDVATS